MPESCEWAIMNQNRIVQMMRRYIREGSLFRENSAGKLGREVHSPSLRGISQ
jgi:hypothetical protein